MVRLAENYLLAEQLIIDRLRDQVPELAFIDGSRSVQEVVSRAVPTPAALVLFGGDTVKASDSGAMGAIQVVDQKWLIELVVRDDWAIESGSGERLQAGFLISKVIKALAGWYPSNEHREMRRTQAAIPVYEQGEGFYQLAFLTEVVTQ